MKIQITYSELQDEILDSSLISSDAKVVSIATDSRQICDDEEGLFFCLVGEQFDGHDYIDEAIRKGWKRFAVSKKEVFDNLKFINKDVILVRNGLRFIQNLAKKHREKFQIPIVAITGSNGKTICKEWIYDLLKEDLRVYRSPKSYNSQLGVAISLLGINEQHDLAIIEAGISQKGEMELLQKMIQPTHGLMTNNLSAHLSGFDSLEQKNKEKHLLFQNTKYLVENEETALESHAGLWNQSNIEIKANDGGTKIKLANDRFELPFITHIEIENAIHSFLVAKQFTSVKNLLPRLKNLNPLSNRWEQFEGEFQNLIINDSYSLDEDSLKISLQQLIQMKDERRIVLILGLDDNQQYNFDILNKVFESDLIEEINFISKNPIDLKKLSRIAKKIKTFVSVEDLLQSDIEFEYKRIFFKSAKNKPLFEAIRLYTKKHHRTKLEIDLSSIRENLLYYNSITSNETKKLVMVKASSYGAGLKEMTSFLIEQNVDYFGVAFTDEGIELRKDGIQVPIIVMNPDENYFEEAINHHLEPAVYSLEHLDAIIKILIQKEQKSYPIHIKIDTGMHRLGFNPNEIPLLIDMIKAQPEVRIKSVFSHFSCADDPKMDGFSNQQFQTFIEASNQIKSSVDYHFDRHICNSNATLRFPKYHLEMVRLGIGIHGVGVSKKELTPTFKLKSYVSLTRKLVKGDTVGYGNQYICPKDMFIGIIPIGYADGITRSFGKNGGQISINGRRADVIGNVCMDMLMVNLDGIEARVGDEVEFFGNEIPIAEHAEHQNTIAYEVISRISERIPRVYLR